MHGVVGERGGVLRILVVDDDQGFRKFIRRILNTNKGLTVVGEALDGEDAVELAQKLRPDMVLMDVDLPRLDGLEATRMIKASPPLRGIVVIMLSTVDGAAYRAAAAKAGADNFLPKTAPIVHILSTIRHSVRPPST
jgi:DNA-binding NarL/FixJ family response regulator